MAKSSPPSPLVAAAAAIDDELREYDELAHEAGRIDLDSEKALARTARLLTDATQRQPRIQEKLKTLLAEIEAARLRQQASLDSLVEISRTLQGRANELDVLMKRFAAVGESAQTINRLTQEVSAKKNDGASETEILDGITQIEEQMLKVVVDAEALAGDAEQTGWPEIARQADSIRQQVRAAKNRLALAHKTVASRAPS